MPNTEKFMDRMDQKLSKTQAFKTASAVISSVFFALGTALHAQTVVLEKTIEIPTQALEKGHSWESVQVGIQDSTTALLTLNTRYPKGNGDQSIASTRHYATVNLSTLESDTAKKISPFLLLLMGEKVYPAGVMTMDSVTHFFYSQFVPKKNLFRLFTYSVYPRDTSKKTNQFQTLFEIATSDPNQIGFRFSQTGTHFGLVFMQLEDDKNDRAILTWKVYNQKLKTVLQRTEKINFGGGNVSLMDFTLTPELVGLTTLEHRDSKSQPNGLAYYVFSKERTSIFQGELFIARNQAISGTWLRYESDSAYFIAGGILAPSDYRLPNKVFHYHIPLQRVDLPRGGIFQLPEPWTTAWEKDHEPFGFRYFNPLNSTYRVQPGKKHPWSMVYLAGGTYKKKPFQSDFLVLGCTPTGVTHSARRIRNWEVTRMNSGVGLFTADSLGAFSVEHGTQAVPSQSEQPGKASQPTLTQILPDGTFQQHELPLPEGANGNYFYEGVELITNRRWVLPYQTETGISLAVYRLQP